MEKIYNDLLPSVQNKLNGAISANYEGSEAQSLLQQAQSTFGDATSNATQGNWNLAIQNLEIAGDFLDQASEAEQKSDEQRGAFQTLLFYVAIIAIVVIIVVSIIVVVVRRRRRQADFGAEQPVEAIEEQSEEQG
jgi:flagellar biosynthesis/type III secretory pathway M-ring protein FliF/YscJ